MIYYESESNNTADSVSPRFAIRLTSDDTSDQSNLQISTGTLPPASLRNRSQWVCWEYEQRGNHTTKPPVDPHTGNRASVDDSSTWADYGTALQYYQQTDVDGIGFVLSEDDPFAGVDWDNCRNPTSEAIDEWVQDEIDEINSYSEVSPSGTGIHTLLYGDVPETGGNQNEEQGIEVYDSGRYFTVSGRHIEDTPLTIEPRTEELSILHSAYILDSTESPDGAVELPTIAEDVDEGEVEYAESLLREFYAEPQTTQRAREYLHDLLNGHYKTRGFIAKDGTADRSEAETALVSKLFGAFRPHEDEDRALELADTYIMYSCRQQRYTNDGQPRKWLTSEIHRRDALRKVSQDFDNRIWKRWRWKKGHWDTWSDNYSDLTYKRVLEAVFALSEVDSHEYPTKDEILESAQEMDPSRAKTTHQTALYRLRDDGDIKMAYLGGNEYVYYPKELSDPPDAEWVKISDEQYSPPSSA